MPVRATKRGPERTPLTGSWDVIVCGASFAGLTVARELAGSGARVLVLDRYEIGERQTSACAAPTDWLHNLGVDAAIRQTFGELVINTPLKRFRWRLPFTFSTFDYHELCNLLWAQCGGAVFETATVGGRSSRNGDTVVVHTDRGDLEAPLVIDALGWRRVLAAGAKPIQPPDARLSRGLEVHPPGASEDLELWLDPAYVRPGYSWCFPAGDELRVGVGSFDPRIHVRAPTVALAEHLGVAPEGYQGNWIPHQMRDPVEDGVFFVGDSAGHCLPTTAEGIRPAFYFAIACGRELRRVLEGRQTRAQALERYAAFCEDKRYAWRWLLRVQRLVGRINPYPAMTSVLEAMTHTRLLRWAFSHYLDICPPAYALPAPPASAHHPAAPAEGEPAGETQATAA
ncbi:MAG TPA: NAD(P)/FAD-dependent oxidoreductase [Solirubrobacteraceae bacterium]|nr:NAD(P)/FAD-dependent oxidoreductase [Solirubrobacteraceae bacterium]